MVDKNLALLDCRGFNVGFILHVYTYASQN